jgi:hypothetical protein
MFPGYPYLENPDGMMPAHTKVHEGNLPTGTQLQSLRMSGTLNGVSGTSTGHPLCRFIPRSIRSMWR